MFEKKRRKNQSLIEKEREDPLVSLFRKQVRSMREGHVILLSAVGNAS